MAEQTPAVENKGMLIVAVALGVVAVLLYNWQVGRIRAENRGTQVLLLRFDHEMKAGDRIEAAKDFSTQDVPERLADGLGDVAKIAHRDEMSKFNGFALNKKVLKGQFLLDSHITNEARESPSMRISSPTMVAKAVPLREVPGNLLSPGDRVNLVARIPARDGSVDSERIIEDVRVLAVGGSVGRLDTGMPAGAGDEGPTMYRAITIEVTPQASLELDRILAHIAGGVSVEVLSPLAARNEAKAGVVNRSLLDRLKTVPSAPGRGASPLGGG